MDAFLEASLLYKYSLDCMFKLHTIGSLRAAIDFLETCKRGKETEDHTPC